MRSSDWSSDVCSSDLQMLGLQELRLTERVPRGEGRRQARGEIGMDVVAGEFGLEGVGKEQLDPRRHAPAGLVRENGRASWREIVCQYVKRSVVAVALIKINQNCTL